MSMATLLFFNTSSFTFFEIGLKVRPNTVHDHKASDGGKFPFTFAQTDLNRLDFIRRFCCCTNLGISPRKKNEIQKGLCKEKITSFPIFHLPPHIKLKFFSLFLDLDSVPIHNKFNLKTVS